MSTTIVMPQLGESVAEGVIGKWLKQEGDSIQKDEPIVEVITDKVNAEIPSPVAGRLQRITQPEGATVAIGQEIAIIEDEGGAVEPPVVVASSASQSGTDGTAQAMGSPLGHSDGGSRASRAPHGGAPPQSVADRAERVRSSPLVRRLAEEHGINLAHVPGSGIGGRVSKQDILSFVEQKQREQRAPVMTPERGHFEAGDAFERQMPAAPAAVSASPPAPAFAPAAPRPPGTNEDLVSLSPLRKMIAQRMAQSTSTIPHATTMAEVDMTNVVRFREAHKEQFRQREGIPLSYVAFFVKATVEALKEYPLFNAEWTDDGIIVKHDININLAVDAPDGLTTPVIHHADGKNLAGLSRAIHDLSTRARDRKLRIEDVQGGTFTVNNTGALGSVSGVSIINYPQGGILAAAAIVKRPVVIEHDGQDLIAVRSMMNLSFSFDHRLADGGYAAGFVNAVKKRLESWNMDYPVY